MPRKENRWLPAAFVCEKSLERAEGEGFGSGAVKCQNEV